ncbi:hypothetical protein C0580_01415 [Candidatus Parcubacteria bacterium]|nr:MAG: hypothetical protein C0580_01415 [Candidatus Parcubacteria bacterium]
MIAYTSIIYTIAYHVWEINFYIFLFVLISMPIIIEIFSFKNKYNHQFWNKLELNFFNFNKIKQLIAPAVFIAIEIILFIALFKKASMGVLRSPWEVLNYKFWIIFTLSNIALVFNLINKKSIRNVFLLCLHFFLIASIGIIIYPLGFGYDSFIHQATLNNIQNTGTIEPRLFMYIGQYGITFFAHHLSQIPLDISNKLLLPILFSLLWPSGLYYGLKYGLNWSYKTSYIAVLWSIFVGINFAVMTTPQSLAFLFLAFIIFILPEINKKEISSKFVLLVAVMTLTIHPMAGLHLLILAGIFFSVRIETKSILKEILKYSTLLLSTIVLPSFLALYQRLNGFAWSEIFSVKLWPIIDLPGLSWQQNYNFPLDLVHNIGSNYIWIYLLITLIGAYMIVKENKFIFFKRLLTFVFILIINYLIAKIFINFNLQISYQKTDYLNRIIYMIALSFLPVFLTSIYFWIKDIPKNKSIGQRTWLIIITSMFVGISTYFSYPVYDKYQNSKSFNVTKTDIKTVQTIEQDANGEDYIVLANQMVGAASIDQYGFAHYYNNNFYYSMPLGVDNIYQNYLNMIEINASREEAILAMDKAGVDNLYLVINNYWHSAKSAIQQAEQTADEKILVDDGVNTVFVYKR